MPKQFLRLFPIGVCWAAGFLLLVASASKYHEFLMYGLEVLIWKAQISSVSLGMIPSGSRTEILILAVFLGLQWSLGIWLLSGAGRRIALWAALILFSAFALVSFQRWFAGSDTCGCFGFIQVQPWVMLIVDLLVVGGSMGSLYFFRKQGGSGQVSSRWRKVPPALGIASGLLLGAHVASATVNEHGMVLLDNDTMVLNPSVWPGRPFPLFQYLENPEHLRVGRHLLLFYRPGCDACERVKQHLASSLSTSELARVVLVMAPTGNEAVARDELMDGSGKHAGMNKVMLASDKTWVYPQPLVIELSDGVVMRLVDIPKDAQANVASNDAKPAPPEMTAADAVVPSAQGLSYDFGYVEKASTSYVRFTLENSHDVPVRIRKVLPECTCISVMGDYSSVIPAKGHVPIGFSFEAPNEATPYAKKIHVELSHDQPDGQERRFIVSLQIKARVGLPLRVTAVRHIEDDEDDAEADILNEGKTSIRLVYSTSNIAGLTAIVPSQAIESGKTLAVRIKLPSGPSPEAGKQLKVHIHTNHSDQPVIDVVLNKSHE